MQFEDSLKKIEEIVKQLEDGDLALDKALLLYKEGTSLAEACKTELSDARLQVTQINSGGLHDTGK